MKTKFYFIIIFTLGMCANLKAQSLSTESSVRKQFTENKIPGANYAQPKQASAAKSKGFEGSSLAKQIRDGKEEGMKYASADVPKNPTGISREKPLLSGNNLSIGQVDKNTTETNPQKVSSQDEKKE